MGVILFLFKVNVHLVSARTFGTSSKDSDLSAAMLSILVILVLVHWEFCVLSCFGIYLLVSFLVSQLPHYER